MMLPSRLGCSLGLKTPIWETLGQYMLQTASTSGNGNVIVQIQGDGNSIVTSLPHLTLTRRHGLTSRIETDHGTGMPLEIDVIRPFTRSIDMVGRETEMDDLRAWLFAERPISVRVITGNAGYGKTRLALELIEEMAPQGWYAGFLTRAELKRFRERHDLADWGWNAPVLVVVDYASASARDLHAWLKELGDNPVWDSAEGRKRNPLRLLLLERQAERGVGWWAEVFGIGDDAAVLEKLADPAGPVALRSLHDVNQRRAILTKTLLRLGSTVTLPVPGDDPGFDRRLAELTWAGVPLLLMLAAATAAREGFGRVLAMGSNDLAFSVAKTELARILKTVEGQNVSAGLAPLVKHVAAVATLRQGLTSEATREVIERESEELCYKLPYGSAALRDAFAVALPNGAGGVAAVEPDMIGEALLLDVWREDNTHAIPAIARAYAADPFTVAKSVIRTCQDYVIRGHRHPLNWLEKIRADSTDLYAQIHLSNVMPTSTLELREIAAQLEIAVIARVHPLVGDLTDLDQHTILAASFNNLSNHFSALGQRANALAAIKETVSLDRELASILPDAGMPKLASSLSNLSNRFSDLGQWENALAAIEEAVEISRDLATSRPGAFRPELANCLNIWSICLYNLGRPEEALAAIEETVEIRRDLVVGYSDAFRPELGHSLINQSTYLSSLGRREGALAASEEAAMIGRDLAAVSPDAFRPALAVYLNNLSNHLSKLGRHDEALVLIKGAVDLGRELTAIHPDAFRRDLARSLINLSNRFIDLDRREEGLVAIHEGVALYRDLTATHPDAFRPLLAKSLSNLSIRFFDSGQQKETLDTIEEAVAIGRDLAAANPDAFRRDVAAYLNNMSNHLSKVGRHDEALTLIKEAIATLRDPFLAQPMAFEREMDFLTSSYSELCKDAGREEPFPALWEPILECHCNALAQFHHFSRTGGDIEGILTDSTYCW